MRRWWVLPSLVALSALSTACQAPYIMKSALSQADLLLRREPIDKVLKSDSLTADERRKLELARDAKTFGENELGLKKTSNYKTYVKLDRPYVTYVVSAAEKKRLEPHLWSFPFVGDVPYKGYFNPVDAEAEAETLKNDDLDTYVRGVSAYSTLGWFNDPVLSSLLRYSDYDLVNTIIHESVHATLYIKSKADFNERLATFIGNIGAELFFTAREGTSSPTLRQSHDDNDDEALFSKFISEEIDNLKKWYTLQESLSVEPALFTEQRQARLTEISRRFEKDLRPKIKNERYAKRLAQELAPGTLNNARLLGWKLYFYDLSDFDRVYTKLGRDPKKMIDFAKSLEASDDPEAQLKSQIK